MQDQLQNHHRPPAFESHFRKECGMPDQAHFQWDAPYMVAALDGCNAKAAETAAQAPEDVESLAADLEWHKEALKRHAEKLASVSDGMSEAMRKTLGHECSDEPFDDLYSLLNELRIARSAQSTTK